MPRKTLIPFLLLWIFASCSSSDSKTRDDNQNTKSIPDKPTEVKVRLLQYSGLVMSFIGLFLFIPVFMGIGKTQKKD